MRADISWVGTSVGTLRIRSVPSCRAAQTAALLRWTMAGSARAGGAPADGQADNTCCQLLPFMMLICMRLSIGAYPLCHW
jgi:hypothetical protein